MAMISGREGLGEQRRLGRIPWTPGWGLALAGVTAAISGVSVFANSYAVKELPGATPYTTTKNLVAAIVLIGVLTVATARRSGAGLTPPRTRAHVVGLLVVAVMGGSIAFVLFFEGLATAGATDAAFIQKTLVVWVALLAVAFRRERVGWVQGAAVAVLVAGQALLGVHVDALRPASGEAMILAATLLWAVEVIVAKRLLADLSPLTVATARLGGGGVLLVAWCAMTGRLGAIWPRSGAAWGWALLTGLLLAAYAGAWLAALARARALDVTAILVAGALLTAILDGAVKGRALAPQTVGLVLVAAGVAAIAWRAVRAGGDRALVVPLGERAGA